MKLAMPGYGTVAFIDCAQYVLRCSSMGNHDWVMYEGVLSVLQESLDKYQHCDLVVDALEVSRYFQARNFLHLRRCFIYSTEWGQSQSRIRVMLHQGFTND